MTMRLPRVLQRVPEDQDVRRLLKACSQTFQERRNRALVALLADSGLRISEALRLRIRDGVGFFGAETAHLMKTWLATRMEPTFEDYLFVDHPGRSLTCSHATHVLHAFQSRPGLPARSDPTHSDTTRRPAFSSRRATWSSLGRSCATNRCRWPSSMLTSRSRRSVESSGGRARTPRNLS